MKLLVEHSKHQPALVDYRISLSILALATVNAKSVV